MAKPGTTGNKAVLVISSHVVRGTVGNRAIALALEALGHPVWLLPTITLAWHPGHGKATRIVPGEKEFANLCDDLAQAPWKQEIAGIISGFMSNSAQVVIAADLIARLKADHSDLVYLCDPVIGDFVSQEKIAGYDNEGKLYVEAATASAIRRDLLPLADIITPNMFELGWLNGENPPQNQMQMLAQARDLGRALSAKNVLVTSVPALMRGNVGSVFVGPGGAIMSEHKVLANPPNGLGDLTSALFMSHWLGGLEPAQALEKTTASVFEILARTVKIGADELALEDNIASLSRPMAMVNMRRLN